jgi:hypothetical protein
MYNVYKFGVTNDLFYRDLSYTSVEVIPGVFIRVYEIDINIQELAYNNLRDHLNELQLDIQIDTGVDLYHTNVIEYIQYYLDSNYIPCKLLTKNEIDCLLPYKQTTEYATIRE